MCHCVVLLLENERDDIAGVGSLMAMMVRPEGHDRNAWATYYEGRVVLNESIWAAGDYFEFGGV